jgi:WD40 repeat protein
MAYRLAEQHAIACDGDLGGKLPCDSHTWSLAFRSHSSMVASGNVDGKIRLWDTTTGEFKGELTGHGRVVRDVIFSPDVRTLLSAAEDGTVRVWHVDTGRCYGVLYQAADDETQVGGEDVVCRVSLSSDGRRLAIGR